MPVTVLVADDDERMRSALRSVFEADGRFVVVATVATGHAAVKHAGLVAVDLVVIDLHMPGGGIECATALRSLPAPPVTVAMSAHFDATVIAALVRVGVRGVFDKGRLSRDVADLTHRCWSGELILATSLAAPAMLLVEAGDAPDTARGWQPR